MHNTSLFNTITGIVERLSHRHILEIASIKECIAIYKTVTEKMSAILHPHLRSFIVKFILFIRFIR